MVKNLKRYTDEELVRSVQMKLKQWKLVESFYNDKNLKKDETCIVDTLKKNYLLLLMEARKRNLSLTTEQLLKAILLDVPSRKD